MATPTEATSAAACYDCIPENMRLPVLIYLYNQISGLMATPAELVANASCYACIEPKMQMPVLIALVAAGGATGTAGTLTGGGSPEGVQAAAVGTLYWDSANNILYIKNTGVGDTGWIVLLGV